MLIRFSGVINLIIEAILNALKTMIKMLFNWINIPGAGEDFFDGIAFFSSMLDSAKSLINFFVPWTLVQWGLPILIVVLNFEHIYHFVMFILKKIPMLGIE